LDNKVFDITDARCNHEATISFLMSRLLVCPHRTTLPLEGLPQKLILRII